MKKIFTLLVFAVLMSLNASAIMWVTVDPNPANANADKLIFTTVQEAVNTVISAGLDERVCVFIKNGKYNESVFIGNKSLQPQIKISLIGESKNGVVIESSHYNALRGVHPSISADSIWFDRNTGAALYVNGKSDGTSSFYAENITFRNYAGIGQAKTDVNVIYFRDIDGFAFKNSNFEGYNCVIEYKKGRRSMFYNCTISGANRLVKSGGTSMLYKCTLKTEADGAHLVEPEDIIYGEANGADTVRYGFMFRECTLTKGDTVHAGTCYLARPNAFNSATVFIDSKMDNHIAPVGWELNNDYANKWSYFGEYKSMNLDGTPADVSQRGNYGIQLTESEVKDYLNLNRVYKMYTHYQSKGNTFNNVFRADSMVVAPEAPTGVAAAGGNVTWTAVDGASGYIVYRDGSFAGFAESNSYTDATPGTAYTVYSYNAFGAMSLPSGSTEKEMTLSEMYAKLFEGGTSAIKPVSGNSLGFSYSNGIFRTAKSCDFTVYDLYGRSLKVVKNAQEISLTDMTKGIYMIKTVDESNNSNIQKVAL